QGRFAGVSGDPLDDHGCVGHEGRPAERPEAPDAERRVGLSERGLEMASRVFAVDLGAWSVKLAVASPGIRGAMLLNVIERLVPPGDEPAELRAQRVLQTMVDELRLRDDTGYIGVYGDAVFTQVLEFGFKNLRRAELDKAVGGE